ncbi:MAG: T9SS type A sorting domain-containing protein [Limnohabitans sp.]|nr:T9SS type A sorting domain-containing protein [Limnohabitans sp.]
MKKILFCFFILLAVLGNAQNPGDVAQNYGSGNGFNGPINVTVVQSDGKVLVGGNFTTYKGKNEKRIIRLNNDGTKDNSFNTLNGFDAAVNSIAIQPDGKIIVGGIFTSYEGFTLGKIIRLNSDGTIDNFFNYLIGFNTTVSSIVIQPDGKILVGGNFTTYKGITENRIIRLNSDGTKDTSFNVGTGFDNKINSIAIQPDGKILVGGEFLNYKGITENRIIRLNSDGTKDTTFNTGTGLNSFVNSIAIQTDGKILLGGAFTNYNGVNENFIIRLNQDGTKDTTFNLGTGFNAGINYVAIQTDGKILIGGSFTNYNGVNSNRIIRLNNDGTKDTTFNIGTGFSSSVLTINSLSNGKIIVGGLFSSYNNITENNIICLNNDGTKDNVFITGIGFNDSVYSTAVQSDGKILVGGMFTNYSGVNTGKITRLNNDGTKDNTFNTGTGFNYNVAAIVVQTDGKILLGGHFTTYNGVSEKSIIRLNPDGTKDITFNIGTGFNATVKCIALQTDGKILIGGDFTTYNGTATQKIVRLNPDGTKDTTFNIGTGFTQGVNSIIIQNDGKIIVGGTLGYYNGVIESGIIRLNADGSKDTSFITGTGFNNAVSSLALQTDGKIIVAGDFTIYKGIAEHFIIRLNIDGTKDTTFNRGTGFNTGVHSIALQTDGKIIVGGPFSSYNLIVEKGIIRLNNDGTKDTTFNTGTGFNDNFYVNSIIVQNNGQILIGGSFTSYRNEDNTGYLIKLYGSTGLATNNFELNNSISVFPNPVKDILNASSTDNATITSLKIYDLQGKLIAETTNNYMNTSNLSAGLYVVKIVTAQGQLTKKFIKE